MQFKILNDRRFWLIFAFGLSLAGFPRGILTEWINRTGEVYSTNHPGGGDFVNFYVASLMVLKGQAAQLFDAAQYSAALQDIYGSDFGVRWLYPPHFLFFIWPLGALPYMVAYALFMGASLTAFIFVAAKTWGGREIVFWLIMAPVSILGVLVGQTAFIVGALMIGSIYWWDRKPIVAGILLGILTVKPQFGVLIPLVLLLERRWLVIAVASATALALAGLSIAAFGIEPWRAFFFGMEGPNGDILRTASKSFLSVQLSTFGAARYGDIPIAQAAAMQAVVSVLAVLALIRTTLSRARWDTKAAMLVVATYLFSPYVLFYDLAAPTFVALWLYLGKERESAPGPLFSIVLLLAASLSFVNGATTLAGVSAGPPVLLALAIGLMARVRAEEREAGGESPALSQLRPVTV
ncbi:glycosyltransferase family 87 protein [Afifella sp. IM 167]|uniref:glycosyltransferase family 87 protein n=1 Tax=Afifella sp. IM 167 TaxID=2033586 RepID=UPI001CCFB6B7|nr:glycosyltransferase family 87 protein [Afifella sp. IM 167]MBZ8133654.1 hypothetical protein [Afifella sp. IM 167]